jgi:hypothetical protein
MMDSTAALTTTFESVADFCPEPGSAYVAGVSVEKRSRHGEQWEHGCRNVQFYRVLREAADEIEFSGAGGVIQLRSLSQLTAFWQAVESKVLYLDITGLRHSTWAALLRGLKNTDGKRVRVVYVEPDDYRMNPRPTQNVIYDLSEKIEGIRPLPGFARFRRDRNAGVFAPLLGFEGTRLQYLINQLEPSGQLIFPIVGVPGFRAEFPFITYWANRTALRESQAWRKVIFAPASCPFATLNVINQLRYEHKNRSIVLAPIGTKPQSLAAVISALQYPEQVEIVYDHPVRKAERTEGIKRLHVYEVTQLVCHG